MCSPAADGSRTTLTYYERIGGNADYSDYLVKLITGKKHQIRCHFSQYLEAPIVGDTLYGAKPIEE